MNAPGYWLHETSGVLGPAIYAYLNGAQMSEEHITAMRAYLRQWIEAPAWKDNDDLALLREAVDRIRTRADITRWLDVADEHGIDPL